MAHEIPSGSPTSKSKKRKVAREALCPEAETLAGEGFFDHVDKVTRHVLPDVVVVHVIMLIPLYLKLALRSFRRRWYWCCSCSGCHLHLCVCPFPLL